MGEKEKMNAKLQEIIERENQEAKAEAKKADESMGEEGEIVREEIGSEKADIKGLKMNPGDTGAGEFPAEVIEEKGKKKKIKDIAETPAKEIKQEATAENIEATIKRRFSELEKEEESIMKRLEGVRKEKEKFHKLMAALKKPDTYKEKG